MFPVTRIVIAAAFVLAPTLAVQALIRALHIPISIRSPIMALVAIPAIYLALHAYARWVEGRGLHELARAGAIKQIASGLALGVGLFTAVAGVLGALGAFTITAGSPAARVLPDLVAMAALSSFTEEVLIRGIIFRISEEALGSWLALLVSAALFGLGHLGNPHADPWSAVAIAIEAGILLGAAYMVTRSLWLPIALHAGWNFTEAGVFGAATSGNELPGLLRSTTHGSEWLSGGAFGAEASVVAVALCLAAGIVLIVAASRRGHVIAPPWRRVMPVGAPAATPPGTSPEPPFA